MAERMERNRKIVSHTSTLSEIFSAVTQNTVTILFNPLFQGDVDAVIGTEWVLMQSRHGGSAGGRTFGHTEGGEGESA